MTKTMLALVAAAAMACARAEAAVYTFMPTSLGPTQALNYSLSTPMFTLVVNDSAVQSGSFSYDYRYRYISVENSSQIVHQPSAVGDVQDLQLFQVNNRSISFGSGNGPDGSGSDYFHVNLTFSTTGQITTGSLAYGDDSFNIEIVGLNTTFKGVFGPSFQLQDSVTGDLTGGLANVPEPTTIGLLGIALTFLGTRRRRHT